MKTLRLYFIAAAVFLAFTPAAQAESKIAIVNIQKIMSESKAAKSVRKQMEAKMKAMQSDLSKQDKALQSEHAKIDKQRGVLSKQAFETKTREFGTKVTKVQKEVQSKKAILDSAFEKAINEIQKSVASIIKDIASEKGYVAALPTSQVIYADKSLDITDEVLKELNKKLTNVQMKFK